MIRKSSAAVQAALTLTVLALSLAPAWAANKPADTETVLYNFNNADGSNGANPYAGLIADGSGNFYGTVATDGPDNWGLVFELSPNASGGWTYNIIYNFSGTLNECASKAGLIFDSQGNLYGTCSAGGQNNFGAAFELSPGQGGTWTLNNIYSFTSSDNEPLGNLILDSAGNVYGTTSGTSPFGSGNGAVFELSPSSSGWTEQVLHSFTGGSDGAHPYAGLIMDRAGNLYGTTEQGGSSNYGTVFKLHNTGSGWVETVLYSFTANSNGSDGCHPLANLSFDNSGRVYGTTAYTTCTYNASDAGGVFRLGPPPTSPLLATDEAWQITWLYHFTGETDGANPEAGVIFDSTGNIYGTTMSGGNLSECFSSGCGVVYQLTQSANWAESVLHAFSGGSNDGAQPLSTLILDNAGNLYGTTAYGGGAGIGVGTVFELTN